MRREIRGIVAEPTQIDQLLDARALGFIRDGLRCTKVLRLKIATTERMDEVINNLDSLKHAGDRVALGGVSGLPQHALGSFVLATRDRDDVMSACKLRDQRPTNGS